MPPEKIPQHQREKDIKFKTFTVILTSFIAKAYFI